MLDCGQLEIMKVADPWTPVRELEDAQWSYNVCALDAPTCNPVSLERVGQRESEGRLCNAPLWP